MKFKINQKRLLTLLLFTIYLLTFCFASKNYAATTSNVSVDAPVALLMDAKTGKIIYEKNAYEKKFPASTTKIMTAILALEHCHLNDIAKVSYEAIFTVPSGYSNANLQLDEELTIEQLLNVLLIPSANDAANVIAEHIAGSVESFSSMMNTKAIELGCKNTHFVNPNGVHHEDHYSTAYDLALMGQYAMKNEDFRRIVTTTRYTLPITNKYDKEDRIFNTTNHLVNPKNKQFYESATGIKTGYTVAAKNCIVASAEKDGVELITVILEAANDSATATNKFNDCKALFDYGFSNYTIKTLCTENEVFKVIKPSNSSKESNRLNVLYETSLSAFLKKSDLNLEFSPEVELDEKMKAPITKGSVIGKVTYTIDGINYTTNLIAGQDIESNSVFMILLKIGFIILLLIIFSKLLPRKKKKAKRVKKKRKRNSRQKGGIRYLY